MIYMKSYKDITALTLSPLGTNCFIVPTGADEAVVIDPADDASRILAEAESKGLTVKKILLTHGHFDHTGAASEIKNRTGAPIYIHPADVPMLTDSTKSLSFFCPGKPFIPCEADVLINDGDRIEQGDTVFTVMSTPGHSAGSVCYLCKDGEGNNVMFAGDTIFKDSIGRSDCWSGDPMIQQESLDKLAAIEEDYVIFTGHGPSTTLAEEKKYNPFIAGF